MGYHRAGFDVYGVDINPQPRYPFPHLVGDAVAILRALIDGERFTWSDGAVLGLTDFDAVHASPPCQAFTSAQNIAKNADAHEDLLTPTRELLEEWGGVWIIENVVGSPMRNYLQLCGSEFNLTAYDVDGELLQLRRHRWFESSVFLMGATGCQHLPGVRTGSVMGHGGGWPPSYKVRLGGGYVPHKKVCAELMGIDWMSNGRELSESIPPVYTEFLGGQLITQLAVKA
jgi:DNA (cytosine-5)-methyltransferase 1